MTKLIINADDFGLSIGANYGIIECFKRGVTRSTTIMAGMPAFEHAVQLLKENPGLNCGVHMTLSAHKPVLTSHKTIVDKDGYFYKKITPEIASKIDLEEIYNEFCAQIERVKDAGINITHLDSHHHVHTMKFIKPVIVRILEKYKLPIRGGLQYELDYDKVIPYLGFFYQDTVGVDAFKANLDNILKYDVVDTMSHPAYIDSFIMNNSSYNTIRMKELDVLTSEELKDVLSQSNIVSGSYLDE